MLFSIMVLKVGFVDREEELDVLEKANSKVILIYGRNILIRKILINSDYIN